MALSGQCGRLHKTAASYLYAAGSLLGQLQSIAEEATDHHKILRLASSIATREFPRRERAGRERVRFLSGITNQGVVRYQETIASLTTRLYLIDDSWGAASSSLLSTLRQLALESGQEVVTCACPLFPFTKIDHLLLPELGLGFVTRNKLHPITLTGERTIHASRFTDSEKLRLKKHRMSFLYRAAVNMLEQATDLIAEAKQNHDQLETYYVRAMDFQKLDCKLQELTAKFIALTDE